MAQSHRAKINGMEMYYEVSGKGRPLVLLHGGLGTVDMYTPLVPVFTHGYEVIVVELQGHGHTGDIERPFSFEQMADDVARLIEQLGLEQADLVGYSLGGAVSLHMAMRHAKRVRKLALISTPYKSEGWFPENRAGMRAMNAEAAKMMVGSPPHQAYLRSAPNPENWPVLVTKTGQLVGQEYDWSEGVAKLPMPIMLVFGDADAVRPAHIIEFYALLGGGQRDAGWDGSGKPNSRLAILPGTTHYDILTAPLLAPALLAFLDAPIPSSAKRNG